MPPTIWKASQSFGLVTIPVEVHTGVRDHRPRFRLLHADDRSPLKFERVCQREGRAVAWEDLVKGYEYEKGRFVVLTKEDFKAAALEVVDLMERLRKSLEATGKAGAQMRKRPTRRPTRVRRARRAA
ncbi:MAG: Ku protein [Vicinamibacterales bacterium]